MEVAKECEPIVIQMFKDAAQEEIEWANYLFKDGSMLGLNADILTKYMMEYLQVPFFLEMSCLNCLRVGRRPISDVRYGMGSSHK